MQIETFGRKGFSITVEGQPDHDYQPGRDDDVYPNLVYVNHNAYDNEEFLGVFPGVSQGDYWALSKAELARLYAAAEVDDAKARRDLKQWAEGAAEALANGMLSFVGITVVASRAGVELGTASLWGVEDDGRDAGRTAGYWKEVASEVADEAIGEAEEKLVALGLAELDAPSPWVQIRETVLSGAGDAEIGELARRLVAS